MIAVELQAHGRTRDIERPLSYEAMAGDMAALLRALDLERAQFVGYSLGGAVALKLALDRPELVERLVFAVGVGLPRARLALLPGTTHEGLVDRVDWLSSMIVEFLAQ